MSGYQDKAIPLISVDQATGSKWEFIQSMCWPRKPTISWGAFQDPLESFPSQVFTEQGNLISLIKCSWIETMGSELDPLSIPAPRDSGVGDHLSREKPLKVRSWTSLSSTLKELVLSMRIRLMTPEYSLLQFWHQAASSTIQWDRSMRMQSKTWV